MEIWHADMEKSAVAGNVTHLWYHNVETEAGHLFTPIGASEQVTEDAANDYRLWNDSGSRDTLLFQVMWNCIIVQIL